MNSLGEMICLGCGTHFLNFSRPHGMVQAFCSGRCRKRVFDNGHRLTHADVRDRIAAMVPRREHTIQFEPIPTSGNNTSRME